MLHERVDGVPRRSRHIGNDRALEAQKLVHQRRLADIGPADHCDGDLFLLPGVRCERLFRDPLGNRIEKVRHPKTVLG